jgi:cytochrome o ubiquinol oxidase subunit 1
LLAGINLITTVLKLHEPGMTYTRMPMFCWTTLASNLMIVAAFPILTATLALLLLDRAPCQPRTEHGPIYAHMS